MKREEYETTVQMMKNANAFMLGLIVVSLFLLALLSQ
jgi:hypothetical protein